MNNKACKHRRLGWCMQCKREEGESLSDAGLNHRVDKMKPEPADLETAMQQIRQLTKANGKACNLRTKDLIHIRTFKGVIDDLTRAYAYLQKEYKIMAEYYTGDGLCGCGSPLAPPSCPQCELKSKV